MTYEFEAYAVYERARRIRLRLAAIVCLCLIGAALVAETSLLFAGVLILFGWAILIYLFASGRARLGLIFSIFKFRRVQKSQVIPLLAAGKIDPARVAIKELLTTKAAVHNPFVRASALYQLATCERALGNADEARALVDLVEASGVLEAKRLRANKTLEASLIGGISWLRLTLGDRVGASTSIAKLSEGARLASWEPTITLAFIAFLDRRSDAEKLLLAARSHIPPSASLSRTILACALLSLAKERQDVDAITRFSSELVQFAPRDFSLVEKWFPGIMPSLSL